MTWNKNNARNIKLKLAMQCCLNSLNILYSKTQLALAIVAIIFNKNAFCVWNLISALQSLTFLPDLFSREEVR